MKYPGWLRVACREESSLSQHKRTSKAYGFAIRGPGGLPDHNLSTEYFSSTCGCYLFKGSQIFSVCSRGGIDAQLQDVKSDYNNQTTDQQRLATVKLWSRQVGFSYTNPTTEMSMRKGENSALGRRNSPRTNAHRPLAPVLKTLKIRSIIRICDMHNRHRYRFQ